MGGIVEIKNSEFTEFSTCGAVIRNKRVILNKTPATTPTTYAETFQARSERMTTEQY
jgi:hypothetical protein